MKLTLVSSFFTSEMSGILSFDRANALKYQRQMLMSLLQQHQGTLKTLQREQHDQVTLRAMVHDNGAWDPLLQILKPQHKDDGKKVQLQTKVVEFLKLKLSASELMIAEQRDPEVGFLKLSHNNQWTLN